MVSSCASSRTSSTGESRSSSRVIAARTTSGVLVASGRQLCERLRSDWIDPVERPRDRAQKCDRIVVAAVEVDPGHQPLRALTPLAGQSRLPVAGGRLRSALSARRPRRRTGAAVAHAPALRVGSVRVELRGAAEPGSQRRFLAGDRRTVAPARSRASDRCGQRRRPGRDPGSDLGGSRRPLLGSGGSVLDRAHRALLSSCSRRLTARPVVSSSPSHEVCSATSPRTGDGHNG